jgi:hypothetical protein
MNLKIRRLTLVTFIPGFLLVMMACNGPQKPSQERSGGLPDSLQARFGWLLGTWLQSSPQGDLYETWILKSDSEFFGHGYLLLKGDTLFSERIRLVARGKNTLYIPVVSDQNAGLPVEFTLVSSDRRIFIFENKEHDFPQRIIYRNPEPDSLCARIEGMANGSYRSEDFRMSKKRD